MDALLDLYDIQGNIMKNYPEAGFIKARYLFFKINSGEQGRALLQGLLLFLLLLFHSWLTSLNNRQFNFDIHASREIQFHQLINRLLGGL